MMNEDIFTSEAGMIAQGRTCLTGAALEQRIAGKTILGDFGQQFKFISTTEPDGTMEGRNNAGAHNRGFWKIEQNTFSVSWDAGWESSTTHAYDVDGMLKFYAVGTGLWRFSFTKFSDGIQRPLVWDEALF